MAEIDTIVDGIDYDDPLTVAEGIASLRHALDAAAPADQPAILLALLDPLSFFQRDDEASDVAERALTHPSATAAQVVECHLFLAASAFDADDHDLTLRHLDGAQRIVDEHPADDALTVAGVRQWHLRGNLSTDRSWLPAYLAWAEGRLPSAGDSAADLLAAVPLREAGGMEDADAIALLDRVASWGQTSGSRSLALTTRFFAAKRRARSGDRVTAMAQFEAIADEALRSSDGGTVVTGLHALLEAGQAHSDAGNLAGATAAFRRAAREWDPTADDQHREAASQAWYRWSRVMREGSEEATALEVLRAHLAAVAGDPDGSTRGWAFESIVSTAQASEHAVTDELRREGPRLRDQLIADHGDDAAPEVAGRVARALLARGAALSKTDRVDDGIADYEHIIGMQERGDTLDGDLVVAAQKNLDILRLRSGDHSRVDSIYPVVRGLVDEGDAASARGDQAEAERCYERAYEMARAATDPQTRLVAIIALRQLLPDLERQGRFPDVISTGNRLLGEHYGPDDRVLAAQIYALGFIGRAAGKLGDRATALRAYDDGLSRWQGNTNSNVIDEVSVLAYNRAVLLDDGSDPAAAVAAYEFVTTCHWQHAPVAIHRRIAKALTNKALTLREELGRPDLAAAEWQRIVALYGGSPDAELARLSERARTEAAPAKKKGLFSRRSR